MLIQDVASPVYLRISQGSLAQGPRVPPFPSPDHVSLRISGQVVSQEDYSALAFHPAVRSKSDKEPIDKDGDLMKCSVHSIR